MRCIEFKQFERGKVMKKILSITLGLLMILTMCSALIINTAAAEDAQVLRQYDRASDADILFYADFNSESYKTNQSAKDKINFTVGDDGRSITVVAKPDSGSDNASYYGASFDQLPVNKGAKVTMSFKIKMNGSYVGKETPTNNSVGVGCWFIDEYLTQDPEAGWNFINAYGNWNCELPDGTLNRSGIRIANKTQLAGYKDGVENATPDDDGFISIKVEYDYEERTVTTFYLQDGQYVEDQSASMMSTAVVNNVKKDDHLGLGLSIPHVETDATIKEFKIFKGLGLTAEQLAITENTTSEVEPTTTAEKTYATRATMPPATQATTVDDAADDSEGGCGGSLALTAVALVPAVAAVAVISHKKKED